MLLQTFLWIGRANYLSTISNDSSQKEGVLIDSSEDLLETPRRLAPFMERHHKLTEIIVNDFPSARFYLNFHTDKRFGKLSFLQLQDQKKSINF